MIIPAVLATTEDQYRDKLAKIESSPSLRGGWVQIDLMDGEFVQNKSIGPDVISKYKTGLRIEAQLMVDYPENWIDELIKVGVDRIIFPVEDESGIKERIEHIKNHGIEVGLSINPRTGIEALEPFANSIDLILVMSVEPGFGGQEFLPETLQKIRKVKEQWDITLEVDGGINPENAKELVEAGVDNLVVGTSLIEGDIEKNIEKFRELDV